MIKIYIFFFPFQTLLSAHFPAPVCFFTLLIWAYNYQGSARQLCFKTFIFQSNSQTRGIAVGIFSSTIYSFDMLFKLFTIARSEFPWATTITLFPEVIAGIIYCSQYGITLSIVVFKLQISQLSIVLMSQVIGLGQLLYIFCQISDVFHHLKLILVEEYQSFFSIFELAIFRVFKLFQVCLILAVPRNVFNSASKILELEYSGNRAHRQRNQMFEWLSSEQKCNRHQIRIHFVEEPFLL